MSSHPQTDDRQQDALAWIPFDKVSSFTQRISAFTEDTDGGNPSRPLWWPTWSRSTGHC